ncbi:MAG: amidohydrolase [Clostridia bacterium]|nr:amidohydrolase [Clostridia bacterium]
MNYLFENANIITGGKVIFGSVLVQDGIITHVGTKMPKIAVDETIDVGGNVLMAGFVNAHAHTPATVLRGVCDDKPLADWLETIIPKEKALSDEEIYYSTLLGIMEYVRGGITCVEECYGRLAPVLRAYQTAGIRARIGIGFPNVGQDEEMPLEKQFDLVKNAGQSAVCYAHSIYGTSEENFEKLITFARKNNLPVATHLSETLGEVGDCSVKNNDLTPPELLEDFGFLDRGATVYHCVHCDKDDLDILANYGASVVSCSSSNLKLASGIAPLYAMVEKGINVALGTDGAYSNNALDMFREMFLAATLQKATLYSADVMPANLVLDMATKNGAKALGFDNMGDIVPGNVADIILIDITAPHHQPVNNIISNLVYAAKSTDVYLTMIKGKILYRNGQYFLGEDAKKIIAENQKTKERLKGVK